MTSTRHTQGTARNGLGEVHWQVSILTSLNTACFSPFLAGLNTAAQTKATYLAFSQSHSTKTCSQVAEALLAKGRMHPVLKGHWH